MMKVHREFGCNFLEMGMVWVSVRGEGSICRAGGIIMRGIHPGAEMWLPTFNVLQTHFSPIMGLLGKKLKVKHRAVNMKGDMASRSALM